MARKRKSPARPDPCSYWVIPGKLLAGTFPGAFDIELARERLDGFVDAGISYFIDLTRRNERPPYQDLLATMSTPEGKPCQYRNLPIPDFGVPTPSGMREIIDAIDRALAMGHKVYLHCWGGIGRTGLTIGCYLVDKGVDPDEALQELHRMYSDTEQARRRPRSPETSQQLKFVHDWVHHRRWID